MLPVSHYHFYLQTAWAILLGFVGWHLLRFFLDRGSRTHTAVLTIFLLAAIASGAWSFLNRKFDTERREEALSRTETGGLI